MLQRLIITYAILTVGFTGISICMVLNGSDYPGNPAWPFVTTARNIFLLPVLVVAAGAGLIWAIAEIAEARSMRKHKPEEYPSKEVVEAQREDDRATQEAQEKIRLAWEEGKRVLAEQKAREQEEARQRQDELKRLAEEKRKNRSAEDAARSGLDDFL